MTFIYLFFSIINVVGSFIFIFLLLDEDYFLICSNYKLINDNIYIILFVILLLQIILLFTRLKYFSLIFGVIGNFFGIKIFSLIYYPLKEYINLNKFIQIKKIISKDELSSFLDTLISKNNINMSLDVKHELITKSVNRIDLEVMFNELVKYYSNVESKKYNIYDYFASVSSFVYDNRHILLIIGGFILTFGTYFYINNFFQSLNNNNNITHISDSIQNLITNETREQQYLNNLSNDVRTVVDSIDRLDIEVQNCKDISQVLKTNYLELAKQVRNIVENNEKLSLNDNILLQKISLILDNQILNNFLDGFTINMIKFLSLYTKDLMEDFSSTNVDEPNVDNLQSRSPTFTGFHRLGSNESDINSNNDSNI